MRGDVERVAARSRDAAAPPDAAPAAAISFPPRSACSRRACARECQIECSAISPSSLRLGGVGQRVIGRAGVGEFGVGAVRRDDAGVQHRPGGGLLPERAVGVPELVAVAVGAALVVEAENLAPLVEVRDVEDVAVLDAGRGGRAAVLAVRLRRHFERAIEARERRLFFVVEMLIGQHRDRVLVHGARDRVLRLRVDAGGEVDPAELGGEQRMQWSCHVMASSRRSGAPNGGPTVRRWLSWHLPTASAASPT